MKKYIVISLMILICIMVLKSCLTSEPEKLIPLEIVNSVKSLTEGNKYVSISTIENEPNHFSIMVELLFEPQLISEVKSFTDAICEDCYRIFKDHNINRTINVWGYRLKDKDLTIMYGRTSYDQYSGKFEFETAKELNL